MTQEESLEDVIPTNETEQVNELDTELVEGQESESSRQEIIEESPNELELLKEEKQALEDRVLRLQAEIANMQRINLKERQEAAKYRSQKMATELIDVVDNLERALQSEVTSDDAVALKKGVEMVLSSLKTAFERENVREIDPQNQPFDPNFHQAVSVMPGGEDVESDTVLNVLQKGYQLHERILRPAMVIVSQ